MSDEAPSRGQSRAEPQPGRSSGLAQVGADDFSFVDAVGGVRGAVETLLPGLLFVVVYTATQELRPALVVSVGVAVLAGLLRLVTRSSPTQAFAGVVGVAVCAFFAGRSGEARDFYVPGFLTNVGYGAVYLLSTVRFPRFTVPGTSWQVGPGPFPVIGLLVGLLTGEGLRWRGDPRRLKAFQRVTWMWAALFGLRLCVQLPLYYADQVGALGVARLVMGVPMFALLVWLTWVVVRAAPPLQERAAEPVDRDVRPGSGSAAS